MTVSHSGHVVPGEVAPGTRSNRRPIKPLQMSSKEVDIEGRVVRLIEIPFEPPEVETDKAGSLSLSLSLSLTYTHTSTACLTSHVYVTRGYLLTPPSSAYN